MFTGFQNVRSRFHWLSNFSFSISLAFSFFFLGFIGFQSFRVRFQWFSTFSCLISLAFKIFFFDFLLAGNATCFLAGFVISSWQFLLSALPFNISYQLVLYFPLTICTLFSHFFLPWWDFGFRPRKNLRRPEKI